MNAEDITKALEDYTAVNSHFETSRNYISLSHCALSVDELVNQYRNGFPDGLQARLRCYKGYQMEADLRTRLIRAFPASISPGGEITAFNGLVQGHPDFQWGEYPKGCPGDCKSVLLDEWIPADGKLPRKVYWQMQGYMLYSKNKMALVIYESRENSRIKAFWVRENPSIQGQIERKLTEVVKIITNGE